MSVEDVDDSMGEGENCSSSTQNGGHYIDRCFLTSEKKIGIRDGCEAGTSFTNIPRLSSNHRPPLCLTSKDLSQSLPVYCPQNDIIMSQSALHGGMITSCSKAMTMTPMTLSDPTIIPSVIGPASLPVASLSDIPAVHSMKLSHMDKDPESPGPVERYCRWMQCNRSFSNLDDLVNHVNDFHVKVERPDVDYQCKWTGCPRLGKGFNARYKMLIHIRTHTNEKPHQCSLCGKCFSRLENLKIHNRSHTGEKPYVCPFEGCNKAYSNSSDRFKHVRTHQEEKPYICKMPGCNKRYTDPSSLRKHVRTIGHYFRSDGMKTKVKKSMSPPPVTSPISTSNILTLATTNGLLGNLPSAHLMPLTTNIFQVSALQSPFAQCLVSSPTCSSFTLPTKSSLYSADVRSLHLHPADGSPEKKIRRDENYPHLESNYQEGPLDLSRSPLPQKEEEISDSSEHVEVD